MSNTEKKQYDSGISRRDLLLAAGAGVSLAALGAWSRPVYAQSDAVLRIMTGDTDDEEVKWYKDTVAAFEHDNPGTKVEVDAVAYTDSLQKLTTQLAAGTPPDMFRTIGAERIATLAQAGVVDQVDDIIDALGRDDFDPHILSQFMQDGKVVGIPTQAQTSVAWFRKDLAEQAGVKGPSNWDELLTFAKATTKNGVYGVIVPCGLNYLSARMVLTFFRQNGGDVIDPELKVAIDSPKNKEALEFMRELFQYSPPGSGNYAPRDLLTSYTAGASALIYYEGRPLARLSENAPEILAKTQNIPLPYKTTPFNYGQPEGNVIFKGVKQRDLAKTWLIKYDLAEANHIKWLLTGPTQNLPVRKSISNSPLFNGFPLIAAHQDMVNTIKAASANSGNFRFPSGQYKENSKGGTIEASPILPTMLQRFLLNKESAESVLGWAQGQVTTLMQG